MKMKKIGISMALLLLLVGCGAADEDSEEPIVNEEKTTEKADDSFAYQKFYLTRMEPSRSDEEIEYSYGFDLPANSITVKNSELMIGLDGQEVLPEPQQLIDFNRSDDGTLTFSFVAEVFTETDSSMEEKTVSLNKLSNSVYGLEDGTQYEFSEEEK